MNKGIVIESGRKWTVVLTADGEFVRIPSHPHHLEGKEITFHPSAARISANKKRWIPRLISGLSLTAACFLFLMMIFPLFGGNQAYAAVTIDINPSFELEIDELAEVISVEALNEQAQSLLPLISWKERPLAQVTLEIIEVAGQKGYMNAEKRVLITTTFYDEDVSGQENEKLEQMIEDVVETSEQDITLVLLEGNKQWRDEAKQKHVSPGAYMLTKQAEKQGISIREADVKQGTIDRLLPVQGVKVIRPMEDSGKVGKKEEKEQQAERKQEEKQRKPEEKLLRPEEKREKKENKEVETRNEKADKERPAAVPKRDRDEEDERNEDQQENLRKKENESSSFPPDDKEKREQRERQNGKVESKDEGPKGPDSRFKAKSDVPEKGKIVPKGDDGERAKDKKEREKEKD